ncbi:hypothetical protein CERSUDRAFT_114655 [Gelatoporia subvermispora B]|uniref:Peptidase S33 tripeptidyl aminopeptidase-like C-terminal domain-containing protein n=1 Tax=Ceriporiopsis subvermispora (strain B) TaxID=914234 RepID=M2PKC3_CERS8|nr:hypothetical protein CERSUDRAFT_114655 [Gelatoporia subvermispora B]
MKPGVEQSLHTPLEPKDVEELRDPRGAGTYVFLTRIWERQWARRMLLLAGFGLLYALSSSPTWYHGPTEVMFHPYFPVKDDLRYRPYENFTLADIGTIHWWRCDGPLDQPGTECGYILVPLDYFNQSAGVAQIALGKYKAKTQPSKGSVFVNPGGPGGSGKLFATGAGPLLQRVIGPEYDIIGFDPRGIHDTLPQTECFPTPADYLAFKAHTPLERGYDVHPNFTASNRAQLVRTQRELDALTEAQFAVCEKNMGHLLRYMGTASVVRDIDFMATAFGGEDVLINFWGGSYGTILGQYLVNMLPHRVGRVVIDGVADAVAWSSEPYYKWYREWLSSTEDTYRIFASECAEAGPALCALAEADDTGADITSRMESFVDGLYFEPMPVPDADEPGMLTYGLARRHLLEMLYTPLAWPRLAENFAQAINGNGTALLNALQLVSSYFNDLARSAVSCNDNEPFAPPDPEAVVDELLGVTKEVSRFAFAAVTAEPDAGCQYWPVTPPERFDGPWNHTLKNPILIVSNTADPITPIVSGRLVNSLLPQSSRLLVQDSPGHCSLNLPSLCTAKYVKSYYRDGELPPEGAVCKPDVTPFGAPKTSAALTAEDQEMLEALESLRRTFAMTNGRYF